MRLEHAAGGSQSIQGVNKQAKQYLVVSLLGFHFSYKILDFHEST